ncbi:MAG: hypothetical protein JOZ41_07690 [Chloroflexi bacterium]|nr:hypothetical protein [Chloroflexota bacterium]
MKYHMRLEGLDEPRQTQDIRRELSRTAEGAVPADGGWCHYCGGGNVKDMPIAKDTVKCLDCGLFTTGLEDRDAGC